MSIKLGVNIDHIATLREVRKATYPNLVAAMKLAIQGGADGITIHLREDRRHIQTKDLIDLSKENIHLNLEIAPDSNVIELALQYKPYECCIVPEKREELTTEGGLDVTNQFEKIKAITEALQKEKIEVSLFINAEKETILAAKEVGADMIEIHTGDYANAIDMDERRKRLIEIQAAAKLAYSIGLKVNAGHGLTLSNVKEIAAIKEMAWLNIGHFLVANSIFIGLEESVRSMKKAMINARTQN